MEKKGSVSLKRSNETEEMSYYKLMIVNKIMEFISMYISLCEKNKYEILEVFSREEIFENN